MGGWSIVPLWKLASANNEVLSESTDPDFPFEYVDISAVTQGKISDDLERVAFGTAPSRARRIAREGDVIMSTVRTYLRAVAPVGPDLAHPRIYSTGFAVLRPRPGRTDAPYLGYRLVASDFMDKVEANAVGVSYPAITAHDIMHLRLRVPELPVQQQIAAYLERETATIDDLIDNQHEFLTKLKERRSAVIRHHLETGACMTDPVMGEVELNKPGWKCLPAKRVCNIRTGCEDSGNATDGGEFPFYVRGARVLRSEDYAFEGPAVLTPGDGQGGTGKVFHYAEGRFQAHQRVYVFHGFRGLVAKYFYYWLSTFLREIALASSYTVTMESLRQPMLERLPVFFPEDPAEQDAIVRAIEADVAKIDALIAKAERFIELAQERRAALITAAVTGQIEIPTED